MSLQLLANGLLAGCAYCFIAVGFSLIYGTTRIFHFAHGAVYMASAYVFFDIYRMNHAPFLLSMISSFIFAGILGATIELLVHRPLIKRGASELIHLLSSIGVYIALTNIVIMIYGNGTRLPAPGLQATVRIGTVRLTVIQLVLVALTMTFLTALLLVSRFTAAGKIVRAFRDDPELLAALSVNPDRLRCALFAVGSAIAAVAAILSSMDLGTNPSVGMTAVLNGAVAVIIGGIGRFEGAALGAFILGLLQSLVVWQTSAGWQEAVTFLVLMIFLFVRPEGLLVTRQRAEEIH